MKQANDQSALFSYHGKGSLTQALPLALQHVVAAIVGCVTPAIIVSNAAHLSSEESVILIQAALVAAALSTLLQIFPIVFPGGIRFGAGLPVIMGVGFAYVPSIQAIAGSFDIPTILGAQIIGAILALIVGIFIKKIRVLFPPMITGTVVFTVGLSLYPTAINYMAGGIGNKSYGSWQNWLVAFITLVVVIGLNHYAKGILKLASILIGIIVGYLVALCFGMVDFGSIASAEFFQIPKPFHFGIKFELSSAIAIGLLFIVNSVQAIGDLSATTTGSMNRMPDDKELQGGILGYALSNIVGAVLGGLPTATYSQNVGIVITTKVINRIVFGMAAVILLLAGLLPKFSALLTTIPQCVLGGATVSVFATIAMTGIKLIMTEDLNYRNISIVGLAVALGIGISQVPDSLALFPVWVTTILGKSPVVIATIIAVLLNVILPKTDTASESPT